LVAWQYKICTKKNLRHIGYVIPSQLERFVNKTSQSGLSALQKRIFSKAEKTMNGQENTLYPHVGHELVN
jgi:hypothetical protein